MEFHKSIFAVAGILAVAGLCSSVLYASETNGKTTSQGDTVALHRKVLQPVPPLVDRILSEAVLPRASEYAPQRALQARQQNALVFELLQQYSSWAEAVDLAALIWSAGYSLAATVFLLGFIRWRWTKRLPSVHRGSANDSAEVHENRKYTTRATTPAPALNANSLNFGARGILRPQQESKIALLVRKSKAQETFPEPAGLPGFQTSAVNNPISFARWTNRSRGEVELALHLEKLQQATNVIGGTA